MSKKKKKQSKKSKTTFKTVKVDWKDHYSISTGWVDVSRDDFKPIPIVCSSIGYLVYEDNQSIVLAQNKDSGGKFADLMLIMKNCIIKRSQR